MKISLNTKVALDKIVTSDGYGYATECMLASLRNLGYEVTINDPSADVGIVFNQPHHAKFYGNQYQILYHPWESTQLLRPGKMTNGQDWLEIMNSVDEVWTPSPLVATWYTQLMGITRPVYVYEHGVDPIWTTKHRTRSDKMRFLHVGGEAARKGWKETSQAFRFAFGAERFKGTVEMTYKVIKQPPVPTLPGTRFVSGRLELDSLIQLYHDHHVFVYPSWGEGFGLLPLQAMATGMPTITSKVWAPYANLLDVNLALGGTLVPSPWPALHPGKMIRPDRDELVDILRFTYDNFETTSARAFGRVQELTRFYSWDRLTQETFSNLENRLKNK